MKEMRPCEAPTHQEDCYGVGDTRDHFTSKAIGKVLGWKPRQIGAPENIQYLSWPCHNEKDSTNMAKVNQLKQQLAGGTIRFGQHK